MFDTQIHLRRRLLAVLVPVLAVVAGCDDDDDGFGPGDGTPVAVMTQNLYLGADIMRVVGATNAQQVPVAVAQVWSTVQATDFSLRAQAIAAEIDEADPHLIGLQEVVLYRVQTPSDYVTGTTTPNATDVAYDFLEILLDALADRGLNYRVVGQQVNADVELPAAIGPTTFFDVRMTDRDVILARSDVQAANPGSSTFQQLLSVTVPPSDPNAQTVTFERGYVFTEATVDGTTFLFLTTHLEVGTADPQLEFLQTFQANELVNRFGTERPIVLVGDFNTGPGATDLPYEVLVDAFTDAWTVAGAQGGFTCCHAEDLSNTTSNLNQRIDLVLFRGDINVGDMRVVGNVPADRIGGLWPSDHAGVVAKLRIDD